MPTAPKSFLAAGDQEAKAGHVDFHQQPLILSHIPPPGQGVAITVDMQIFRIVATVTTVTLGLFPTGNKLQNSLSRAEDEAPGCGQCSGLHLAQAPPQL